MSLLLTFMELDKLYEDIVRPDELPVRDYAVLKQNYNTRKIFKNRDGGDVAELLDELNSKNIPYEQYLHKKDNGITIFYDKIK